MPARWILAIICLTTTLAFSQRKADDASTSPTDPSRDWTALTTVFHQEWPEVTVQINGQGPFLFILDSGCPRTVLSEEVATRAGFEILTSEKSKLRFVRDIRAHIGAFSCALGGGVIEDLDPIGRAAGLKIDGMLGCDFFERHVVRIDYLRERVTVLHADTFDYAGAGTIVPMIVQGGRLLVHGTIDANSQAFGFAGAIDTGGHLSFGLASGFAISIGVPVPSQPRFMGRIAGILGAQFAQYTRAETIRLGTITFPLAGVCILDDIDQSYRTSQLLVGTQVLRRFCCTFDAPRRRLILEPNEESTMPLLSDDMVIGFGCTRVPESNEFVVKKTWKASPAAGQILPGDIVLALGDVQLAPSNLVLSRTRRAAQAAVGKPVPIRIRREGKEMTIAVVPKDRLDWPDQEALPESDQLPALPNDNYWKFRW